MAELKYSKYNYEVTLPNGTKAIYNLLSGKKLRLESPVKEFYELVLQMPDSRLAQKWKVAGFLTDGDELTQMKLQTEAVYFHTQILRLTVCPTTACNFRCSYCFENHDSVVMNQNVQNKLVAMVKRFFHDFRPKQLHVTWFGGEPLLQPGIIENLSRRFMALCADNQVQYAADIVTNGYLLTQKMADLLAECRVKRGEITLDGLQECNDRTRIPAGGGGSFTTIIGNLEQVRFQFPIFIRCNLTASNKDDYPLLKQLLQEISASSGNKISSYSRPVNVDVPLHKEVLTETAISVEDWLLAEQDLEQFFLSNSGVLSNCLFCHGNSFVVGPEGNLYKCRMDVTIPERRVGNLLTDPNPFLSQFYNEWGQKYLDSSRVLEDPECRECLLLPVCRGGCPHSRIVFGKKKCLLPIRGWLDKFVLQQFAINK